MPALPERLGPRRGEVVRRCDRHDVRRPTSIPSSYSISTRTFVRTMNRFRMVLIQCALTYVRGRRRGLFMMPWERVAVCVKTMATGFYAPCAGSRICTCFIFPSWVPSWESMEGGSVLYALTPDSVALDFRLRFCFNPRVARSAASLHSIPLYPSCLDYFSSLLLFCSPGRALLSWRCVEEQHYLHHPTTPATELLLIASRYWTGLWAQLACLSSPSYGV